MVVCEHPLAAEVGVDILRRGGNAVDAAVATALALAVVFPQAGNLGGGGFAVVVPAEGEPRALDFREVAPAACRPELYLDEAGNPAPDRVRSGVLSIGVPGSPAGLYELHRELGSSVFAFEQLCRPAVRLAREGFRVDERLADTLASEPIRRRLERGPGSRAVFYPEGRALQEGDLLVQEELADTIERYGRRGPSSFYRGATARAIATELEAGARANGLAAWIAPEDMEAYRPKWREPLRGWFGGMEVITMPPPSSGGVVLLQVLAVLEGFPLELDRLHGLEEVAVSGDTADPTVEADACGLGERAVHWWIEALRAAFAERAVHLGDPDFHDVPTADLLSPEWVARARIGIGGAARNEWVPAPLAEGTNTTHLSVLDEDGSAVSLTTTLNSSFGSGVLVRGAGFLLNNELDDFSLGMSSPNQFGLVGGEANRLRAGARPLSSMTPTVLRERGLDVSMVLGSPGGPRIITSIISVVLRSYVYEQPLEEALAAPRFHQQWSPTATEFEPGWPPALLDALRRRGHEVIESDARQGSVQAIRVLRGGVVVGASDPRRTGAALATR
jgi:gamma-glutamyltranspeptidase/glutathione hydrolase